VEIQAGEKGMRTTVAKNVAGEIRGGKGQEIPGKE